MDIMQITPRERVAALFRHEIPDRMPITLDVGGGDGIAGPYLRVFKERQDRRTPRNTLTSISGQ